MVDSTVTSAGHEHRVENWWSVLSASVLVLMLGWFAWHDFVRMKKRRDIRATGDFIEMAVQGMTCDTCVARLEETLQEEEHVTATAVTLHPGRLLVQGKISEERVRELVESAGFQPVPE